MVPSRREFVLIAVIAAALWVVPSLGTQGMGTIGKRFSHPDRDLVETAAQPAQPLLQRADTVVEASVLRAR